ncbi:MAG: type II secretion system protein GspG [Kiritimatiellae bacterium]|nr:type II secretion system protein GspG [Kiritimatiellia bacterium]
MRKSGFTTIEIGIVLGLVAVLVAIAIPSLARIRRNARIEEARSTLEMIHAAVRQLAWDTGKWPGGTACSQRTGECWDLTTGAAGLLSNDGRFSNWQGPYISKVPKDPWGSNYFFDSSYRINGQMKVVVGSFGPNRVGPNKFDSDDIVLVILQK